MPHKTNTISKTTLVVTAPIALYTGTKLIQSNGDIAKAQRLARKDRDSACNHMIKMINTNCDHDLCKKLASTLEQLKSTQSQRMDDTFQDKLQDAKETKTSKEVEKIINEYSTMLDNLHQKVINQINEINKPKK